MPMTDDREVQVVVRLEEFEREWLHQEAQAANLSLNAFVRRRLGLREVSVRHSRGPRGPRSKESRKRAAENGRLAHKARR